MVVKYLTPRRVHIVANNFLMHCVPLSVKMNVEMPGRDEPLIEEDIHNVRGC